MAALHVGWVEPMMTATVFFSATWPIEAMDVRFIQGETQQNLRTLGFLENQRVPRLSIRELQIIRNTAAGCRCRGLLGFALFVPVTKYCRRLVSAEMLEPFSPQSALPNLR